MRIISIGLMPVKRPSIRRPFYPVRIGLTIIFFLLAPEVFGQPALFGAANLNAAPTRTPMGFVIEGRGFIGRDNPKRVRKSVNWLRNHGAGHLIDNFSLYAGMVSDHWYLLTSTDAAWTRIRGRWIACGGRFEQVARSITPRNVSIYIEDRPFTHPQHPGLKLAGLTDGQMIRASILSASGILTDPDTAWLVTYPAVAEYEFGNLLGVVYGLPWTGVANEIGDRSPCGR